MQPASYPPGDVFTGQAKSSLWRRHPKTLIAACVVLGVLAMSGFVMLVLSLTVGLMKNSGAYQQAVAAVRADQTVINTLGTPIEEGYFVTGEIHLTNRGGYANLSIPISGPDGEATIYVEANKSGDAWSFRALEVVVHDTGQWIHLGGD